MSGAGSDGCVVQWEPPGRDVTRSLNGMFQMGGGLAKSTVLGVNSIGNEKLLASAY